MLRRMVKQLRDRYGRPLAAILGAVLMGAGFIGLPSISDDLARWPPIIAQAVAVANFMISTQGGRWVLFGIGVAVFYKAVTMHSQVAAMGVRPFDVPPSVVPPSVVPPPQGTRTPVRTFVEVEPAVLLGLLSDHTDVQGQRLITPYVGKWLRVAGSVWDVREMSGKTYVQIHVGPEKTLVGLLFEPEWGDRLGVLRKNDAISAIGKVESVSTSAVTLHECELVVTS